MRALGIKDAGAARARRSLGSALTKVTRTQVIAPMKFIVLVYNDPALLEQMPPAEFNATMRTCLGKADEMQRGGTLLQSEMLEDTRTARSIRERNGRKTIVDGPFAETKEVLGGFNIIEARDMDEAMRIADQFPWSKVGSIEVRPIREVNSVRRAVGLETVP
jgi:hypothetical protein